MLDLGWSEILIIGVVALIVVGPKDLPKMLRTLGQFAGRAKGIAREFQRSMDDAARQADIEELHDLKKGLDDMRDAQHKMQRDMGQSFLDGPQDGKSKPAAKKSAKKSETKPTEAKAKPAQAEATPAPAADPAPRSTKKIAKKSTKKPTEPKSEPKPEQKAEPGSVSGA